MVEINKTGYKKEDYRLLINFKNTTGRFVHKNLVPGYLLYDYEQIEILPYETEEDRQLYMMLYPSVDLHTLVQYLETWRKNDKLLFEGCYIVRGVHLW